MARPIETVVQKPSTRYLAYSKSFDVVRPKDVYYARRRARNGNPAKLWKMLEHFRTMDKDIRGAMQSLASAVTQEGVTIKPEDESGEAERQRAFFTRLLQDLDTTDMIEDLIEGHYYGFRAHAPQWDAYGFEGTSYQAPVTYERLPMEWIYARKESRQDDHTTLYVGDRPYYEYPDGVVLLYTADKLPSFKDIDFTQFGAGLAAARFGVFSWFNIEDWAAFNEAFGTPAVIGTLLEGWSDEDKDLLKKAVMNITGDMRAIITDKGELDFAETSSSSGDTFDKLRQAADRAKSQIIKSETLTDNMGDRGSYAAMRTTNGIRLDVASGIAEKVQRLINRQLIFPTIELNFSSRLVHAEIPVKAVEDLTRELKIDQGLHRMGVELSKAELRERYGRRAPEGEEDALAPRGNFDPFGGA